MAELNRKLSIRSILWSFLKLSPISFGGGYAVFPSLEKEIVTKRGWLDERALTETLTLAASAPGGVGINAAFLIGYRIRGIWGALAAGIGSIVPTILIVMGLFLAYVHFGSAPKIQAALIGVTWGVASLILLAALRIGRSAIKDKTTLGVMLAGLACLQAGVHPIYLIAGGISLGFVTCPKLKERPEEHASLPASDPDHMYFI